MTLFLPPEDATKSYLRRFRITGKIQKFFNDRLLFNNIKLLNAIFSIKYKQFSKISWDRPLVDRSGSMLTSGLTLTLLQPSGNAKPDGLCVLNRAWIFFGIYGRSHFLGVRKFGGSVAENGASVLGANQIWGGQGLSLICQSEDLAKSPFPK